MSCAIHHNEDESSDRPYLWTPFEIEEALAGNEPIAVDPTFPTGLSPSAIMTQQADGTVTLNVAAAFAEGQPAAYVISDVWRGYPEIWAQPWYVLVTAWNEQTPQQSRLKDETGMNVPALVDVAPGSGFYSPFWVVTYVEVPPDTDPARYRSASDFLREARPLHFASLITYPMRPTEVGLPKPKLTHPILGTTFTGFTEGAAVLYQGTTFGYFNLGSNNVRMDEYRVIEEVPLFMLATRGSDGAPQALPAPAIGGVGPLLSGRPVQMSATGPRLDAYYRITWAMVPATAEAFDPDTYPSAAALIAAKSGDPQKPLDARIYKGRVAVNAFTAATATAARAPDCFASASFPDSCQWLDSQAHVESLLGRNALIPTAVTVAAATVPINPAPGTAK